MRWRAASLAVACAGLACASAAAQEREPLLCGGFARSLFARAAPHARVRFLRGGEELGAAVAGRDGWAVLQRSAPFGAGPIEVEVEVEAGYGASARGSFALEESFFEAEDVSVELECWLEIAPHDAASRALVWRIALPRESDRFGRAGQLGEVEIHSRGGLAVHRSPAWIDALAMAQGRWSLPREALLEDLVMHWRGGEAEATSSSLVVPRLQTPPSAAEDAGTALALEVERSVIASGEAFDLRAHTSDERGSAVGRWIAWELVSGAERVAGGRVLTAMALGKATWSVAAPREGALMLRVQREDGVGSAVERALFQSGANDPEPLRWLEDPRPWRIEREIAVRWHDRDGAGTTALAIADSRGRFLCGTEVPAGAGARRAIVRPLAAWGAEIELWLAGGSGASLRRRQLLDRSLEVQLLSKPDGGRELRVEVRDASGRAARAQVALALFDPSGACRFAAPGVLLDAGGGAWVDSPSELGGSFTAVAHAMDAERARGAARLDLALPVAAPPSAGSMPRARLLAARWEEWVGEGEVALPVEEIEASCDLELEIAGSAAAALWAEELARDEEGAELEDALAQSLLLLEIAAAWPAGASGRSEVLLAARARARRIFERLATAWDRLAAQESALAQWLAARILRRVDERSGPTDERLRAALQEVDVATAPEKSASATSCDALRRALEARDGAAIARAFGALLARDAAGDPALARLERAELLFAAEQDALCAPRGGRLDLRWNERAIAEGLELAGPARRIEIPRAYRGAGSMRENIAWSAEGRPQVFWRIWSRSRSRSR